MRLSLAETGQESILGGGPKALGGSKAKRLRMAEMAYFIGLGEPKRIRVNKGEQYGKV